MPASSRFPAFAPPRSGSAAERLIERLQRDPVAERQARVAGLRPNPAPLDPKYFSDVTGGPLHGANRHLDALFPPPPTEPPGDARV